MQVKNIFFVIILFLIGLHNNTKSSSNIVTISGFEIDLKSHTAKKTTDNLTYQLSYIIKNHTPNPNTDLICLSSYPYILITQDTNGHYTNSCDYLASADLTSYTGKKYTFVAQIYKKTTQKAHPQYEI